MNVGEQGGKVLGTPEEKVINVHFVPHSHLDAGWLKTYDQYFNEDVIDIFNSIIKNLTIDEAYTYTVGDMAFFKRYYTEADEDV